MTKTKQAQSMAVSCENQVTHYSSSDDDTDAIMLLLLCHNRRRRKRKRKHWVHPLRQLQPQQGTFVATKGLMNDPAKFLSYYRMLPETFQQLLSIVGPRLQKQDTNFRLSVSSEERLLITLRYLASGSSFHAMSFTFLRGETTIGKIVHEGCKILWDELCPIFMPFPTEEQWYKISETFYEEWQMPNCIGSINGKHIEIQRPKHCGSAYHNYMGFFSTVLVAVADADCCFTTVCVGDYGINSDADVLRNSAFGHLLQNNNLNIPQARPLPNELENFPFYFIGDKAFPLTENIMRPYPARGLNNEKRIFNARISRARKTVECAFESLSSKFKVLYSKIACEPQNAENIVKATCILHNFIHKTEMNIEAKEDKNFMSFGNNLKHYIRRGKDSSLCQRDKLMKFFIKPENSIPEQDIY